MRELLPYIETSIAVVSAINDLSVTLGIDLELPIIERLETILERLEFHTGI